MEKSRREKERSVNAFIETTEKVSKWSAVLSAVTFFVGYFTCLALDVKDKRNRRK
jgi:hypothetical protein